MNARGWLAIVTCVVAIAVPCATFGQAAAPVTSPTRVPDVPYEPTPQSVVTEIVKLAQVGTNDVVYDLGCGDGRIVIAAAKLGARGVCVDIDPERIRESRANAEAAGVADRILFLQQDLFDTDIRDATVVTLFLWPEVNLRLRPKLWRELKPDTRIISYVHDMGDWAPQETRNVEGTRGPRKLFLWTIHAAGKRSQRPVAPANRAAEARAPV